MSLKPLPTILSIFIGVLAANYFAIFSGMNPDLSMIFGAFILGIILLTLILIFREPNKKVRLLQLFILVLAIAIGAFTAKTKLDALDSNQPRIYKQIE